jgi:hypothetical protein
MGMCSAYGGCVEYQHNTDPHLHANAHLVNIYQFGTLKEVALALEQKMLTPENIFDFKAWVSREEHFDHEGHYAQLAHLEQAFQTNYSAPEHNGLCLLPSYIQADTGPTLWDENSAVSTEAATADAKEFKATYEKDAQYVISRRHHHIHLKNTRTGLRQPLSGCRSKRSKLACKGDFPKTKRLNLVPKVVCPGNARKHGLRVSGRRNALGSVLSVRRCEWMSECAPGFAVIVRDNTHTAPNYRVPLTEQTHDAKCKKDCLRTSKLAKLCAIAQRAQRNTTGYFTGYIQKRQPVGKFELQQAAKNMQYLVRSIQNRSHAQQYHHVANRMLGDLEFRGHARPATEEFNLAANFNEKDAKSAEFIRTFRTQHFCGAALLHRLSAETKKQTEIFSRVSKVPFRSAWGRKKNMPSNSFEELYGFRGHDERFYYLSPWEFTMWWRVEVLSPPNVYETAEVSPRTKWTKAGVEYWAAAKSNFQAPAPKALLHYVVVPATGGEQYVCYPEDVELEVFRNQWVMVRRTRPMVPEPAKTPLPRRCMEPEERSRIFSVYLRPWVLNRAHSTAHVPHIADLDVVITEFLGCRPERRYRGKAPAQQFSRSYALAWRDYTKSHVVSQHAVRIVKNFLSTHMAESAEVLDEEEEETRKAEEPAIDTSWASMETVRAILNPETKEEQPSGARLHLNSNSKRIQRCASARSCGAVANESWQT